MSLAYLIRPAARRDIDTAYLDYETRSPGLGDRFLVEVADFVQRVRNHPHMYGVVHGQIRAGGLQHFPQLVYYRAESTRVVITAVLHGRRHPRRSRRRR